MKAAIIIGTAPGWRDDIDGALALAPRGVPVCTVNHAGMMYLRPITHWMTVHGDQFGEWIPIRAQRGGNLDFEAHSCHPNVPDGVRWWPRLRADLRNGSSGLFAVMIMLQKLGFERLILAGVHMMGDVSEHVDGFQQHPHESHCGYGFNHYTRSWEVKADFLRQHVRSMDGWTRELLGYPEAGWFDLSTARGGEVPAGSHAPGVVGSIPTPATTETRS